MTPWARSRSAAAREPTSGSEARNRSSRSPAASAGTRTWLRSLRHRFRCRRQDDELRSGVRLK